MLSQTFNRREFVRTAAMTGGSLALSGWAAACLGDGLTEVTGPGFATGATTRYPLRIPAVVSPSGLALKAAPGSTTIVPGTSTTAWMYNAKFPAPTIQAVSGSSAATVTFTNQLSQKSITHWHGLLVDPANDGHPRQAVSPGGSYTYHLQVNQRAALTFYHPHPHMMTGEQVYRGLAGAFIVRDAVDTGLSGNPLGLPSGAYEIPLIIRDASFDSSGNFQFSNKSSGYWGNTPLVNGTYAPYLAVNRGVYRFRMLNSCNARVMRLALSNGAPFTLIGNDGGLLDKVYTVATITAAPAERFDVLLDFRGLASGAKVMLRDLDANWDILEFRGTGATGTGTLLSGALSTITALSSPQTTRRFSFDGMTRINGKVYDISATVFKVPYGTTERWTFVTNGNGPHPVHVHGAVFQVKSRTGGRGQVYAWERGWKDTVLVNDGESVDVLIRFTAHKGLYLLHCHQLAHEDAGMMANFEVV
jgi:blue copper oxidase